MCGANQTARQEVATCFPCFRIRPSRMPYFSGRSLTRCAQQLGAWVGVHCIFGSLYLFFNTENPQPFEGLRADCGDETVEPTNSVCNLYAFNSNSIVLWFRHKSKYKPLMPNPFVDNELLGEGDVPMTDTSPIRNRSSPKNPLLNFQRPPEELPKRVPVPNPILAHAFEGV